ncbi:hypothetical protein V6N13_142602 [Hibiscus sabdariffa]
MKDSCGVSEVSPGMESNKGEHSNPNELYGPWMQVVNRRRMNANLTGNTGMLNKNSKLPTNTGSRFAALDEMNEDFVNMEAVNHSIDHTDIGAGTTKQGSKGLVSDRVGLVTHKDQQISKDNLTMEEAGGGVKLLRRADKGVGGFGSTSKVHTEAPSVAARGKVVEVPTGLSAARHKAVNVVDRDGGSATQGTKGRMLPASIIGLQSRRGSKMHIGIQGGVKNGNKTRKNDQGVNQPALRDRFLPLLRDLDEAAISEAVWFRDTGGTDRVTLSEVDWHQNSAFEQPSDTNMQV